MFKSLSEIKSLKPITELAADLKQKGSNGENAALEILATAKEHGLGVKDYIILAGHKQNDRVNDLNAFELLLKELNLPIKNDFENGITLEAANDTFSTYPGTRLLFPEVVDAQVRFKNRQDSIENISAIVANTRTISGNELISTVVDDDSKDRDTFIIAEGANIPVRSIKTSTSTVKLFKHGSGIKLTYEFNRRASIDIITPYLARVLRELELSKVKAATNVLINGDGVNSAAPVVAQSSFNGGSVGTATNNVLNWKNILKWIVTRAKAGVPIDTVLMNWDAFFEWMIMFGTQGANAGVTSAESLEKVGVKVTQMPTGMQGLFAIVPALSSSMPAGKILGFTKAETLEELVEAGSLISESESAIKNQTITIVRTENSGFKLVFGDTRSIFQYAE